MPDSDPRDAEDQYFLKRDMEKIKELRHELDIKRSEEGRKKQKEAHWMKCPKCGLGLEEINYSNIMIDRCAECKGIWLDSGELELLTQGQGKFTKKLLSGLFN